MHNIGFIGAGNMGFAMMNGILKSESPDNISFTDIDPEKIKYISEKLKICHIKDSKELAKSSKFIVLAVKPQNYIEVMDEIKEVLTHSNVIITIAPGFKIEDVKRHLGDNIRVVRTMPNTPSMVGEGMSVISFSNDGFEQWEIDYIKDIFQSLGKVEIMEENYLDMVVPVSGSSPAYGYMMIEAMADAGVLMGLPKKLSYKLAAQSILGAAKMVLETGKHPGELKDEVCSPGGTTIEAVATLEKNNFRSSIIEAMMKCYEKTKKLSSK